MNDGPRSRLERWVLGARRLVPGDRRDWIDAIAAEIHAARTGREARRWALGTLPVVSLSLALALVRDVRRGGVLMRTIVATVAVVAVLGGFALGGMFVFAPEVPIIVLAVAIGLVIQGGYTLAYSVGALDGLNRAGRVLLLVGNTLAVLFGAAVFVQGIARNVRPATVDPEYGPMTVALLIGTLGVVALAAFVPRSTGGAQS